MNETLYEARISAAVAARANRLFEDGYSAAWKDDFLLSILSPAGSEYEIDLLVNTCTCPFFVQHGTKMLCKHLLGYEGLLAKQNAQTKYQ